MGMHCEKFEVGQKGATPAERRIGDQQEVAIMTRAPQLCSRPLRSVFRMVQVRFRLTREQARFAFTPGHEEIRRVGAFSLTQPKVNGARLLSVGLHTGIMLEQVDHASCNQTLVVHHSP